MQYVIFWDLDFFHLMLNSSIFCVLLLRTRNPDFCVLS